MSKCLIVAFESHEVAAGAACAQALGCSFDAFLLKGSGGLEYGAGRVITTGLDQIPPADVLAKAITEHAQAYTHIAAVSSMQSKDVMARVAGLLDCGMVTDVIEVESDTVFKRPIVAGSIIETVEALASPLVITFRPAGFAKVTPSGQSETVSVSLPAEGKAKRVNATSRGGSRPDLSQAKVVVSGGRPLKDAATFESIIGGLADALGGAAGATRAAVDSGIAANELQVGQTGKIVAPDLYIAAGISGSTQHMAGIKDSKTIVAINKDPDAPIFEVADFGLVADLYQAIPELRSKLGK